MSLRLVVDAAGLIALARLGLLEAVATVFGRLVCAQPVIDEATVESLPGARAIKDAIDEGHIEVVDRPIDDARVALALGRGELATIELASELGTVAVLDDRDARRVATRRGIRMTGTIALLVRLKRLGVIESVREQLDELDRIGFRVGGDVRAWALAAATETDTSSPAG